MGLLKRIKKQKTMTKKDKIKIYLIKHGYKVIGHTEGDTILFFCQKGGNYFWLEVTENGVVEHSEIEIPPFPS